MQIPKLEKVVINMSVGDAIANSKALDVARQRAERDLGQKPVITKAKKSIAAFKLREGMNIGGKVTLRGERMYVFLDKLFNIVLPRIRDFRGLRASRSTAAATTTWACASSSCSRRSTSTRSTRRAAWTSYRDDRQDRRRSDGVSRIDGLPLTKGAGAEGAS